MLLYIDSRFSSPYALSAFVGLAEKGLPFDLAKVVLAAGEQHRPDYATTSLTQRVPTLVDGDFSLSESSAITEYLDEVYPGAALYPREPRARARARQVQAWLRSDLLPIRLERSTNVIFFGQKDPPLTEAAQAAVEKFFAAAGALLAHGGANLFDQWSIADVDLTVMINRLLLHGDPVPAPLVRYAQGQWARPSVQAWVARAQAK